MAPKRPEPRVRLTMYARAVDDAELRLRELRFEQWGDLGLAAFALGLAVGVTQLRPALALPLFVGGVTVWALGIRALWRRWDLVDRLAGECDAYVISEVRDYALRETTMARRRALALRLRRALREPTIAREARVEAAAEALEALASELEDEQLVLDAASAVACVRLLGDVAESPRPDAGLPTEDVCSRVAQIRRGFAPHRLAS
jgi:hypothetical protein